MRAREERDRYNEAVVNTQPNNNMIACLLADRSSYVSVCLSLSFVFSGQSFTEDYDKLLTTTYLVTAVRFVSYIDRR